MYLLGHLGVAAGAIFIAQKIVEKKNPPQNTPGKISSQGKKSTLISNVKSLDFRILFAGVLFPDVIDKPIGFLFFDTTRIFGHSISFHMIIFLLGMVLFRKSRWSMLTFVSGSLIHLVEDQMWKQGRVLFWPFLGFDFLPTAQRGVSERFSDLVSQNYILIPEIIGGIVLILLAWRITSQKSWGDFLNTGRIR